MPDMIKDAKNKAYPLEQRALAFMLVTGGVTPEDVDCTPEELEAAITKLEKEEGIKFTSKEITR